MLVIGGYLLFVINAVKQIDTVRSKLSLVLLTFPIPYFLYLGSWVKPRGQYMLPMYLFEAVFAAVAFLYLYKAVLLKAATRAAVTTILVVLLAAIPVYKNTLLVYQKLFLNDPRTQATEWIKENIDYDSAIAGLGTVAGDYGGDLPYIRRCNGEEGNCYHYHNLGELDLDTCSNGSWDKWFSQNEIDYLVLGGLGAPGCFKNWAAGQSESIKKFEPVWSDMSPAITVLNLQQ